MRFRFDQMIVLVAFAVLTVNVGQAQDTQTEFKTDAGFESLFNGKDLTGWNFLASSERQKKRNANWKKKHPNETPLWSVNETTVDFEGKTETDDGRFVAVNGCLVVTSPPEGRRIQMLFTKKEYSEDFTLKLQFKAAEGADSGVFIKGKQLQCRDYPNAGPYKNLKKFNAQQWNDLFVVAKGENAYCTCNGEVLEAEMEIPAKGPIGVEGDRGRLEYRNIQIGPAPTDQFKPVNKTGSWNFQTSGTGKGSMKEEGDAIVFSTTQTSDENWHVQAYQSELDLEEGATYTVSFEIKSPESSPVNLVAQIDQDDWHSIGLHEQVSTSPEYADQSFSFTVTDSVKFNNRIGFVLGESAGTVSIKNLKLSKQ